MNEPKPTPAAPAHDHRAAAHDDHHDCPDCEAPVPYVRTMPKVGRNDPCTCGSGRKFKKCCGA